MSDDAQTAHLVMAIGETLFAFVAIQAIPYGRTHLNSKVVAEPTWEFERRGNWRNEPASIATATKRSGPPTRASRQHRGWFSATWTRVAPS